MALAGFATGALVTAPVVAVLTWLAVTWEQHVDVRVERDTVAARADRAAFAARFDSDWSTATGQTTAVCDPQAMGELTRLRARTAALEAKLVGSRAGLERSANDIQHVLTEAKQ